MRARQLCGLLLFLSLPLCFAQGKYDPCDVQGQYTSLGKTDSSGQIIGLAFWINGQLADWDPVVSVYDNTTNTTTNTSVSLHPCVDKAYLTSLSTLGNLTTSVQFGSVLVNTSQFETLTPGTNTTINVTALPAMWQSVYLPVADQMSLMTIDITQQDTLLKYYTLSHQLDQINKTYVNVTNTSTPTSGVGGLFGSGTPVAQTVNLTNATYYWKLTPANTTIKYVSVVAFAGSNGNAVRSLPRYMRSNVASETMATGVVTQLVLVARYKTGKLYQLAWEDMGCSGCGGTGSTQCMLVGTTTQNTQSFACAQSNCSTYTTTTVFDKTTNTTTNTSFSPCNFGSYIGFSGTDKYGKPFKSGPQIELLRKYSVSKLASVAAGYARFAATYAKSNLPTTPSGTNSNSLGRRKER